MKKSSLVPKAAHECLVRHALEVFGSDLGARRGAPILCKQVVSMLTICLRRTVSIRHAAASGKRQAASAHAHLYIAQCEPALDSR